MQMFGSMPEIYNLAINSNQEGKVLNEKIKGKELN